MSLSGVGAIVGICSFVCGVGGVIIYHLLKSLLQEVFVSKDNFEKILQATFITKDDCDRTQNGCKAILCGKIEVLRKELSDLKDDLKTDRIESERRRDDARKEISDKFERIHSEINDLIKYLRDRNGPHKTLNMNG